MLTICFCNPRCHGRVKFSQCDNMSNDRADFTDPSHFVPNITMGTSVANHLRFFMLPVYSALIASCVFSAITGAPILSCVFKGVPGIFMDCHMMVAQPEKVCSSQSVIHYDTWSY